MRSNSLLHTPGTLQNAAALNSKLFGVVEKKIDDHNYSIKTSSGPLILKINTSEIAPGDRISISFTNNSIHVEKSGLLLKNVELRTQDAFTRESLSNFKFADLLHTLTSSLHSDAGQNIKQNAAVLLSFLQENKITAPPADKSQLRSFISETEELINQNSSLPKETVSTLQKILDTLKYALQSYPDKNQPFTFSLAVSSNLKEGLYSVTSVADAAKLLNIDESSNIIIDQLEIALKTNGKLLLRVLGNDSSGYVVSSLAPESSALEISSFIKTLKSPLLQSLPQESIKTVLDVRNNITFDALKNLDTLLKGSTIQLPIERVGSREAAVSAASNWFFTALETAQSSNAATSQPPVIAAHKISYDIESINNLLNQNTRNIKHLLSQPGITEEQIGGNEKHNVIPLTIQKLGFDFEASAVSDNASLQPSLKKELLILQHNLQKNTLSSKQTEYAVSLEKLKENQNEISKLLTAQKQIQDQNTSEVNSGIISPASESLSRSIQKITINSTLIVQSIQNLISTGGNTDSVSKDIMVQIDFLLQMLRRTNDASENYLIDLHKRLSGFIETLSNRSFDPTIEELQHNRQTETAQLSSEKQPAESLTELLPSLQSTLRQTIDSTLGRLESLQLLARQIPVPDGQQQMLALPMKIGGEWTEVNIRFLKRKNSSKKKNPQSSMFSVSINLAPKQLGPISVKMDYVQKKSLRIAMNFEMESTKNYFQKFSDEIKVALRNSGLPLLSLEIAQKKNKSDQKEATPLDTLIDMKV